MIEAKTEDLKSKHDGKLSLPKFDVIHAMMVKKYKSSDTLEDDNSFHLYTINGKQYYLWDHKEFKLVVGEDYNFVFDKNTGDFMRWGTGPNDDPEYSPIGPEIWDCEITINGCLNNCRFCYKNNKNVPPTNMTLETFKKTIDKFPKTLTQIAFGITGVQSNPDFIPMMEYCREVGIIPNFTLSGMDLTDELAKKIAGLVGALAVSAYQTDKNVCYDTVEKFVNLGVEQTNIHLMVSEETVDFVYEVLNDRLNDERLQGMNAIVLLGVKNKGRASEGFNSLSMDKFQKLIQFAFENNIDIGFDSCSAQKFEKAVDLMDIPDDHKKALKECSESCESGAFSFYTNVNGDYFPCSFTEDEDGWTDGISVTNCDDFFKDIWYCDRNMDWRKRLLESAENGCRKCLTFPEINV